MQTKELATELLLPRVLLVRFFDTELLPISVGGRVSESYELSLYTEGNGSVTIGETQYPISYGAIRFTRPGTHLSSVPPYKSITVYFDFGESGALYKNQILDAIPAFFQTTGELQPMFAALVQSYESTEVYAKLKQNAQLLTLLTAIFESLYATKRHCDAVRTCMTYMQAHFSETITLETLGALSGYSRLHLMRLFERDTGQTPHKWLTAIRLNHAKKLLSETNMKIDEIAAECGFGSVSHFKVLFKELTCATPGAYRRNARQV